MNNQKSASNPSINQETQSTEKSIDSASKEAINSLPKETLASIAKGFFDNKENENSTSPKEILNKESSNNKIEDILKKPETQAVINSLKELKTNIVNKESVNTLENHDNKIDLNLEKESSSEAIEEKLDNKNENSEAKDPRFIPNLKDQNNEKNR